jgi:hypothetical protein
VRRIEERLKHANRELWRACENDVQGRRAERRSRRPSRVGWTRATAGSLG